MGVKDFEAFIKLYGVKQNKTKLYDKIVAIDFMAIMYKLYSRHWYQLVEPNKDCTEQTEEQLEPPVQATIQSLLTIQYDLKFMGATDIIWCFDGYKKDNSKIATLLRKEKRRQLKRKLDATKNKTEYYKLFKQYVVMPPKLNERIYGEFIKLGISVAFDENESEGERLACNLVRMNKAHAVFSTDTDVVVMGANFWIKEYDKTKLLCYGYSVDKILRQMSDEAGFTITKKIFRDMCIMLGCDYNTNIKTIGKVRIKNIFTEETHRIGQIQKLILPDRDFDVLNVERCKEHFGRFTDVDTNCVVPSKPLLMGKRLCKLYTLVEKTTVIDE